MTKNRIKILDASRGLAALIVLFHHFIVFNSQKVEPVVSLFVWKVINIISELNSEAVLFFFIISGFCIGLAQKGRAPANKTESKIYFYKRLRRILPIYFIALFITYLIGVIIGKSNTDAVYQINNFLGNLFFLQTPSSTIHWFIPYGNNSPLWSLSYEMFFYIFFVFFSFLLTKLSIDNFLLISILLLMLTLGAITLNHYFFFTPWFSFTSLFIIWYYGYVIFQHHSENKKNDKLFGLVLILSTIFCLNPSLIHSDTLLTVSKGLLLASTFYWMLRIRGVMGFKKYINKIERVLIFLFYFIGKGSYALYVMHYIILILCRFYGLNLLETAIMIIFTIIICTKLEEFVQKYRSIKKQEN